MNKIQSEFKMAYYEINIIQFMPYFPPHKGGLETVGQEIGINWKKNNLGNFINIITSFNQELVLEQNEKIFYKNEIIGYKKNDIIHLVIPSFEIINNFPMYKFWDKKTKLIFKYVKENILSETRVITHTRFFLTSLFGGIFARKNKIKWIHIEHGSDYVKLSSKLKTNLSIIYDKIFGKWIFKKADNVLAISEACKIFINNEFVKREVNVFYRGIEISDNIKITENLKQKFNNKIIIGYIGRLYKWKNVESLIKSFYLLDNEIKEKIQFVIVGDGEDFLRLKRLDINNNIYFTGGKDFSDALSYQKQFDIHIHPSSPGGGLATTLLQAMYFGCFIVATPNEGAKEVIENNKNGILLKNDNFEEINFGIISAINNLDKKQIYSKINKEVIEKKFKRENNIINLYNLIK
ncbi:MAG: glycosyltransferase family 4 protein [Candidatus Gracilibacteria bacterium]|nr:glycosyltransferase family 4 protein [Candidatus Gracilibacteria bacterium]